METFASSRVKKRFLKQVFVLGDLLREYGFMPKFVFEVAFQVRRNGKGVVVMMRGDERRFEDDADIFVVCNLDRQCTENMSCRNMVEILNILVGWDLLGEDEIPQTQVTQAALAGRIRCDACDRPQKAPCRFKQCKLCHDREKLEIGPEYTGFYCGKECQIAHWSVHRKLFHS